MIRAATLAAILLAPLPAIADTDLRNMNDAERSAFRDEVRAYLLDNPEVLMEAIAVLEERQADQQTAGDAAMIAAHSGEIFEDPTSWVGGNPEGDVTVVEFLDYRCSFCRRAHPEVAELLEGDGNIRLVVKEFPILGEQSVLASRFAIATRNVAGDAAYGAVLDGLMTMNSEVNETTLARLAEVFDLDFQAIRLEMENPEIDGIIARNRALAQRLGINGTPSFIFDETMVRGYVPLDRMQQLVADARAD